MDITKGFRFKTLGIVAFFALSQKAHSQETTSLGFGYNAIKNKSVIDFQFNRTPASDAESAFDIKLIRKSFVLNPAAEAHLGAGNESSPNNVILLANIYYKNVLPQRDTTSMMRYFYKLNIVSPEAASDKNFRVYQGYTSFGGSFRPTYRRPDRLGDIQLSLGTYFNYGFSKLDSLGPTRAVSRFKFEPSAHWYFSGVNHLSGQPPELDPDFYYRLGFTVAFTQYSFFQQDERVVDKKSLGYFTASFSYRFVEKLKLNVSYKKGRLEPLYKDISTLTFGIALVN